MTEHYTRKPIIALTGGGSGGHLYPLLAVADELFHATEQAVDLVYVGPWHPLNEEFVRRHIMVHHIASSKLRRYLSLLNLVDVPKFFWGLVQSLSILWSVMPDAVFSKGGPGALAVVLAAWFYRIPVVIHESDAVPGLTNRLSAPFAHRIGISFAGAASHFPANKVALVGNPARAEFRVPAGDRGAAKRLLGMDTALPLILVLGGSQGAARLNSFVTENIEALLGSFQIFHQTGTANLADTKLLLAHVLERLPAALRGKYRLAGALDAPTLMTALTAADIVLSRSGAGAIAEIALAGAPALLVPLPGSAKGHQLLNAEEYAGAGAAVIIEEANLTPHIVMGEAKRILETPDILQKMRAAARAFAKPDAALTIAQELLRLAGA